MLLLLMMTSDQPNVINVYEMVVIHENKLL